MKQFWLWIFRLLGWELEGEFPKGSFVVVGAPHTSNWDFLYGRVALYAFGVRARYLIKQEWFRWPMSWFFQATGGIPVNREKTARITNRLADQLQTIEDLKLVFPAEGTRSRVARWKTGFYWVAVEAELPIIMGFLDYRRKVAGVSKPIYPSGDQEKDFAVIEAFYQDITPCVPENFNRKIY